MKLSSKPADSIPSNAFHQVPFLNISEALHGRVKTGVLGNMLAVQLFICNDQEATSVQRSVYLFLRVILDVVYSTIEFILMTLIDPCLCSRSQACCYSHLFHLSCSQHSGGSCLVKHNIKPPWLKPTVSSINVFTIAVSAAQIAGWSSYSPVFWWLPFLWLY